MTVEPNQHDDEALAKIRADQADPIVQYLIVRKSLNMGAGKIVAQAAHATKMLMIAYYNLYEGPEFQITKLWLKESFRTIVLAANDKQWEKLKKEVRVFVVRDAGLTEVPTGSETVMSTWPMRKSKAPKIIQRLQLLK